MKEPSNAPDEQHRQSALDSLHLVYSPAEERFDRITRLAARHFAMPIALVSLVSEDLQWFKSSQGLIAAETSREISFCGHAILQEQALVLCDTLNDPDFADNPLVLANPKIRFYAGQPLFHRGMAVGTLCIIDRKPHEFGAEQLDSLQTLAACVEAEFDRNALSEPESKLLNGTPQDKRKEMIDPITQTWNEFGLNILLSREIELAVRQGGYFALTALEFELDATDFESLTEDDGTVLVRKVAQNVRSSLRPFDLIARTGLNRLVVFSPNSDSELSELLFERMRSRVTDSPIMIDGKPLGMRLTGGIAVTDGEVTTESLLDTAYGALADSHEDADSFRRYSL
jgi:GAF domain-containing protein